MRAVGAQARQRGAPAIATQARHATCAERRRGAWEPRRPAWPSRRDRRSSAVSGFIIVWTAARARVQERQHTAAGNHNPSTVISAGSVCPDKHDSVGAAHHRAGPARILLSAAACSPARSSSARSQRSAMSCTSPTTAPALASLHPILVGGSSQVFAADGTRLGFIQSDELRTPVGWSEIPTDLKNATVAIEDQRFYKNDGVDLTGIFRAAVKDITNGAALQGGSTITMQLIRNLYLGGDQHTLKQKIVEAKLALDYNEHHSKRSILTSYLNSVPYGTVGGQTAIGVQAAARIFFDKPASQLDLEQSALLAGLPQAPSQYNPFLDPPRPRQRRNEVLAKMAELHYISAAQAHAAERAPLEVHLGTFYSQRSETVLLRIRPRTADPPLRREDRRTGRAEGLYDDRPEQAAPRAQGDRRSARRARRPGLGDRHDQPAQRRHRGDGRVRELRAVPVQPRRRRPPPARLDVQGDRPRRRALARDRPEQHLLPLAHARRQAGCPAIRPTKSRRSRAPR